MLDILTTPSYLLDANIGDNVMQMVRLLFAAYAIIFLVKEWKWLGSLTKRRNCRNILDLNQINNQTEIAEEYAYTELPKEGIYAGIWFFALFPVFVMGVVGGQTLINNNPSLLVPCIIFNIIMICAILYKLVLFGYDLVSWLFKGIVLVIAVYQIENHPLEVSFTKKGDRHARRRN